jgi:hypothetical protein
MLDICVLYGPNNANLVSKMIANIFAQQPSYRADLSDAFTNIASALDQAATQCTSAAPHPTL